MLPQSSSKIQAAKYRLGERKNCLPNHTNFVYLGKGMAVMILVKVVLRNIEIVWKNGVVLLLKGRWEQHVNKEQ